MLVYRIPTKNVSLAWHRGSSLMTLVRRVNIVHSDNVSMSKRAPVLFECLRLTRAKAGREDSHHGYGPCLPLIVAEHEHANQLLSLSRPSMIHQK